MKKNLDVPNKSLGSSRAGREKCPLPKEYSFSADFWTLSMHNDIAVPAAHKESGIPAFAFEKELTERQ